MSEERTVPFSVKELAGAAGVHVSAVRQLCQAGKLEAYKVGRDWLIPVAAGRAWLQEREERERSERERWNKF